MYPTWLEIVGSNFFGPGPGPGRLNFSEPDPEFLFFQKLFYSFKILFKFEAERRYEDTGCFYSIIYLKTSTSCIFLREFWRWFYKNQVIIGLYYEAEIVGSQKFGPGPGPGQLNFFGPGPYPDPTGSGSGTYPTISNTRRRGLIIAMNLGQWSAEE